MTFDRYRISFGTNFGKKPSQPSTPFLASLLILAVIVLIPVPAHAQTADGLARPPSPRAAINMLGWISIGSGVVGTGTFTIYSKLLKSRPLSVMTDGRHSSSAGSGGMMRLAVIREPLLNFHLGINSIGFFAGMAHGFFLMRGLDIVSVTLALSMTVAIGSGILLKFGSRKVKLNNVRLHGNISLVILIILLTSMHVLLMRGGD